MSNIGKEQEYEEIVAPDCFGYYDGYDPSCKRCRVKKECQQEQADTRPPCFGLLHDEDEVECTRCLDASDCVTKYCELKGETEEMARKVRVRKRPSAPQPEPEVEEEEDVEEEAPAPVPTRRRRVRKPEPEPEPEEDEEADNGAGDYDGWSIKELKDELESRGLDNTGRKADLIKKLLADDAGEDEEEEPEPAPKSTRRRTTKSVRKSAPEPEEDENEAVATTPAEILESLTEGQAVVITRVGKNVWQLTVGASLMPTAAPVARGRGLRGKDFEKEAFTEEYYNHLYVGGDDRKPWKEMTSEERYEFAAEIDANWEEHEDSKTDQMRMGMAVREALGIEKWKEEYASRAARRALRGYA